MSEDKRDQLGILRYELNFIEQGGYGNRFGSCKASIFEDSLTCPNHGERTITRIEEDSIKTESNHSSLKGLGGKQRNQGADPGWRFGPKGMYSPDRRIG